MDEASVLDFLGDSNRGIMRNIEAEKLAKRWIQQLKGDLIHLATNPMEVPCSVCGHDSPTCRTERKCMYGDHFIPRSPQVKEGSCE